MNYDVFVSSLEDTVQCESNAAVPICIDNNTPHPMCDNEKELWREGVYSLKPKMHYLSMQDDGDMACMSPAVMHEDDFMAENPQNTFAHCMKLPEQFGLVTFMVPVENDEGCNRSACFVKERGYGMRAYEFDPRYDPIKTMPRGSAGKGMFYKGKDQVLRFTVYDVVVLGAYEVSENDGMLELDRRDFSSGIGPFERLFSLQQAWTPDPTGLVEVKYSGWANCHIQALRKRTGKQHAYKGDPTTFAVLGQSPGSTLRRFSATI